jgi:hypothetical protein
MTIFRDGTGRLRPAQLGSCSVAELEGALESTRALGIGHFVLLSHNFEMLKQGRSNPDGIVVRRFEKLCKLLAARRDEFTVSTTAMLPTFKPAEGVVAFRWPAGNAVASWRAGCAAFYWLRPVTCPPSPRLSAWPSGTGDLLNPARGVP